MLLSGGAMAWLTALDQHSTYPAHVLPPLLVLGLGLGMIFATGMNLATAGVQEHDAGVASAMVNTSQQVGGSVGTSLLNTLATSAATHYLIGKRPSAAVAVQAQLDSYSTAYWWSAGFFAVGIIATAFLYRSGPPRSLSSPTGELAVPV
jgi:hypothetical protein